MDTRAQDMLVRLPVDAICASACQPRTRFAEQSLVELSESIRQHGLLSPVVVRRMGEGYELIAGERRLRAVRQLGQPLIDALIRTVDAREAALLALIENLQREDLHYLEQAQAFRQLLLSYGFSQEALAARLGISQGAVANKLRLLKLPEPVRARLIEHGLSERH
ncbi:MAG: ParB/RepB/Spo0J family partition protein, partial [Christensenellaceae bacterium]|nr:ParB/RepB/Spo0J family partition protein [Christensenellaceae bacterium]